MVSDNATAVARGRCRDIDDDDVPNNNNNNKSNPADEHIIYISRKVGKANPKRDALLFFGFLMLVFLISYQTGDVGYSMNSDNNASNDDNDHDNNNGGNKNNNNNGRRHHSTAAINGWGNRRKQLRRALLNPLVTIMNHYLSRNGINNSDDLHNCDYYLGSSSMISSSSYDDDDDDNDDGGSSSWGIFAGRNYLEGELILMNQNHHHHHHHHHHRTTQKDNNSEEEEEKKSSQSITTIIQPLSFLLKPHSILSNVRWDSIISSSSSKEEEEKKKTEASSSSSSSSSSSLVATRDIREGEELFLSWNDHPYYNSLQSSSSSSSSSLSYSSPILNGDGVNNSDTSYDYNFANRLPTLEHYRRADDLIRDAISVYLSSSSNNNNNSNNNNGDTQVINNNRNKNYNRRNQYSHGGRNNGRWNKNNAKAKKKKQQKNNILIHQDIKSGLLLLQRAVARYDHPLVAKLLPTTEFALKKYHQEYHNIIDKPSASMLSTPMSILGSLNNQTVISLAVNAQCMSHIRWAKSSSASSSSSPAPTPQVDKDITTTIGEDNLDNSSSSSSSSHPQHQQIVSKANGFLHGDVLAIVPLLILQDATSSTEEEHDDESCSASSSCTTTIVDTCIPLQEQYSARTSLSSSTLSLCPLFGIQEVTQDPKRANVEYRWSTTNDDSIMGQKTLRSFLLISSEEEDHKKKQLQLEETLLKKYPLSMTWNLVALRDLQQNETLVVYQPENILLVDTKLRITTWDE